MVFWKIYLQKEQSVRNPGLNILVREATNLFNWSRTQNENENNCLNYKVPGRQKKKDGEEKAGHQFLVFHQGSFGPRWMNTTWEDAVYCTVVTQIVTSHSKVQDDHTKF